MKKYKHTLNLPKTSFPIKSSTKREAEVAQEFEGLYHQLKNFNGTDYVLHDGPPYANGNLHHGHILNKILKDMVYKFHVMRGFNVDFRPGWDCHGLPIEQEVDKKLGPKRHQMSKNELRKEYRDYAAKFVETQREQFKRLGVVADWENPYLTMSHDYEAQTLREFANFVEAGLVYRDLKPVFWCPTHRTALANNDIEYKEDHTSTAVYVAFPLSSKAFVATHVLVWTTTPWTLSVNKAIAYNENLQYVRLWLTEHKCVLVAKSRVEHVLKLLGTEDYTIEDVPSHMLPGVKYEHPLSHEMFNLYHSDHVTADSGTGLVHIAPAHGEDDFRVGRKYNLPVESAIGDNGKNTKGLRVDELTQHVVQGFDDAGMLVYKEPYMHKYPYSARSHKPVIMKATHQWFIDIDKPFNGGPSLRERALKAVSEVNWLPEIGENRITGMLKTRPDWCISRQRTWGVPIPALKCDTCNEHHIDANKIRNVANIVEVEGLDFWFASEFSEFKCEKCNEPMRVETSILDVWFDSGVSNAAVLGSETVDLYLEGSDQHRGWFQSSLLAALGGGHALPFKKVVTHGFVVDEKGEKLSKSKKNFTDPFKVINNNKYGAEVFRTWVAQSDFRNDVRVSQVVLDNVVQTNHRIRNTVKYLISNLYDFDFTSTVPLGIDREIVARANQLRKNVIRHYENFNFHLVVKEVENFCIYDLSSFYVEATRDRLYCDAANSSSRKAVQNAMYEVARVLITTMAPIMSFTMHDAWQHMPKRASEPESVFSLPMNLDAYSLGTSDKYEFLEDIRSKTFVELEKLREKKEIGAAYEAVAKIIVPQEMPYKFNLEEVRMILGVSNATITTSDSVKKVTVLVESATGSQCQRCWRFTKLVNNTDVCDRCDEALGETRD